MQLVCPADTMRSMSEAEDQMPEMDEGDFPLPPVSFEFLTLSLKMQAEMQLGLLHFGEEKDRPKPNLQVARHTIVLLGLLQEKTRGNLTMDEQRLIENSLTELRFRYIQVVEETNKQQAAAKQESAAE
jgi:hypothetical protein